MRQIMPLVVSLFMSLIANAAIAVETPKTPVQADEAHAKDHVELTKLREVTEKAINTRDFETLKPFLVKDNLTVITVDGQKFVSLDAFRDYWTKLFENKTFGIDKIEVKPVADGPTEFLSDNVGVCHGTSNDRYYFKTGDVRVMPERWSAVVVKDNGVWKVSRIIFSANILDNPVVTTIKDDIQKFVIIAVVAGAAVGIAIGALGATMMRKKA
jgi:hypothetical protein